MALLFVLALAVRVAFYFFGTPLYYGSSGYQLGGDFRAWARAVENLIALGEYTTTPSNPDGPFHRPPGYGLFLLPFYLITRNWESVYVFIAAFQIFLDSFSAVLLYKAILLLTGRRSAAVIGGLLYAIYFFALGWSAVLYPETLSIFFTVAGFHRFACIISKEDSGKKSDWFLLGAFWGIAALMRIQILTILPVPLLIWAYYKWKKKNFIPGKAIVVYVVAVTMTYGLWPIRNYVAYGEVVPAQRLMKGGVWSEDITSYLEYLRVIKTDHEPQFSQALAGEFPDFPADIRLNHTDSVKIKEAISLMNHCGRGTQLWKRNKKIGEPIEVTSHCDEEVARIWDELAVEQKRLNPVRAYLSVPLSNLSKAAFKTSLNDENTPFLVSLAFMGRSLLLLLGLICALYLFLKGEPKERIAHLLVLGCFAAIYLSICFVYRNIEMRYFLPADVLLLVPAAIGFDHLIKKLINNSSVVGT